MSEDLVRLIEKVIGDAPLAFDKIEYSKSRGIYTLYLSAKKAITMREIMGVKKRLAANFKNMGRADVKIALSEAQIKDKRALTRLTKEFLVLEEPAFFPFLEGMDVEVRGNRIDIILAKELAPDLICETGALERLGEFLADSFAGKYMVGSAVYRADDATVRGDDHISKLVDEELFVPEKETVSKPAAVAAAQAAKALAKADKPAEKPIPSKTEEKPKKAPTVPKGGITNIADLEQGKPATIYACVSELKCFPTKDGNADFYVFDVSDKTSSVTCKFFAKHKKNPVTPATGKYMKLTGEYLWEEDRRGMRDGAFVFKVMKTAEAAPPEKSKDTAEVKRVELHLHTMMSAQDGLCSASAYVKRAAEMGHKAIAITDHGVVQAFPEATNAAFGVNKGRDPEDRFKIIYGVEGYLLDDTKRLYSGKNRNYDDEYVVFDLETTGTHPICCGITEIGAVRVRGGEIIDTFNTFVDPKMTIPSNIVKLTGITNDMVQGAPSEAEALRMFADFAGDSCLVAHNAEFDTGFIRCRGEKSGLKFENDVLDTLMLARVLMPKNKSYALNKIAAQFGFTFTHHRASADADVTARILLRLFEIAEEEGVYSLAELDEKYSCELTKHLHPMHIVILAKNKKGLSNLYRLVSHAHLENFYRRPRMNRSKIEEWREGLIVGSACEAGELYLAALAGAPDEKIEKIARFYDYLEIQPLGNNKHLLKEGGVTDVEVLKDINRRIVDIAERMGKPVVATCDCHFLEPEDSIYRAIVMDSMGFDDADEQAPLYFRTTDEMLAEFDYLGEETAYKVVVENTNLIASMTEEIELFQRETAMPEVPGSDVEIRDFAYASMKKRYGDPLPEHIEKRLERELGSIIKHGFSVLYWIAQKLVQKSVSDGYLVGSRGSVGSSLAAYALEITEVNPLPPHYVCPNCQYSDFAAGEGYGSGVDMPPGVCPKCGTEFERDGYDIPFEVFLGIDADKVPDIDLNFSGDYQPTAHKYVEQIFGEGHVFRAGTISGYKEKTAIGIILKYMEKRGKTVSNAEINRLARGIAGVKRTTGQHPGGMVIVPKSREVYEFTAIQKPADKIGGDSITTHFDFNSMHDVLIKLDILGHDNPTIIRMLEDTTGIDPLKIPLNDEKVLSLFSGVEALNVKPEDIMGIDIGTLGIPEFGTNFVRGMLSETRPSTMAELVRISGLSHGTDVWNGNAKELIMNGTTTLAGAICTRDDIMNYLVKKGMDQREAFFIMEAVRKGQWAKGRDGKMEERIQHMQEAGVEEWFIESCRKIAYMFPKAHAVAYVVMSLRIAYCKVYYPAQFYATFFTVRADQFDATTAKDGISGIMSELERIRKLPNPTATEESMATILELEMEMYARGIKFLPVDLKKSKAKEFVVEDGNLRMPFASVPKLGEKAAIALEEAAREADFYSVSDVKARAKLSSSVIELMREMGCFDGLPENDQLSIFDM